MYPLAFITFYFDFIGFISSFLLYFFCIVCYCWIVWKLIVWIGIWHLRREPIFFLSFGYCVSLMPYCQVLPLQSWLSIVVSKICRGEKKHVIRRMEVVRWEDYISLISVCHHVIRYWKFCLRKPTKSIFGSYCYPLLFFMVEHFIYTPFLGRIHWLVKWNSVNINPPYKYLYIFSIGKG